MSTAFRFLTRIPLPGNAPVTESDLGAASAWFPAVGVVLGALVVAAGWVLREWYPAPVTAALLLAGLVAATGGLHLDGLMDTADGLMGSHLRERSLEIMKDSRVGAMGVTAGAGAMVLKFALLAAALQMQDWWRWLWLFPVLGRWALVYGLSSFPYARAEGGLGRPFALGSSRRQLWVASGVAVLAAWALGSVRGMAAALAVWLFTALLARQVTRRLGGLTGDVYGALNEVAEITALLVLVGRFGW
ncbi:MAG: adenosylcobinamide-GDP ribazoletransferase [Syntrophomonadaceae bacterium]|jgi:adenosylcobinamide-GDP ribazoletransferase|nr:adenosylcobinamide-GDP ribazoletransferase [Syntrophomonadaceae bacterium]MDH7497716.1 adenosylcobinamide-GDP ribazoletransferase [Syntrophomonadaceae bacterium]